MHVQVRLCRQKTTGKVFAMKKLKKAEMVRRGQVSTNNSLLFIHTALIAVLRT